MTLAMVWVLPVPGGPWTTTPSLTSNSCTIRTCSSLNGLGKKRSFAFFAVEPLAPVDWSPPPDIDTPRNSGRDTSSFVVAGSVTTAQTASGSSTS